MQRRTNGARQHVTVSHETRPRLGLGVRVGLRVRARVRGWRHRNESLSQSTRPFEHCDLLEAQLAEECAAGTSRINQELASVKKWMR